MQIQKISSKRFFVSSESSDKLYTIRIIDDGKTLVCDCMSYRHRRKCKHADAVNEEFFLASPMPMEKKPKDLYGFIDPYKQQIKEMLEAKK